MNNSSRELLLGALRSEIASAMPGARLPSTRELTAHHGVSPVTVQKVLRTLVAEGLIEARPGVGTFVRERRSARSSDYGWQTAALTASVPVLPQPSMAMRVPGNDVTALHSGYPDRQLLPERLVRAAVVRAARSDSVTSRPPSAGMAGLQAWFAADLGGSTPATLSVPSARDVIIIPGSQIGLVSIFRSVVGRGGALLLESPTYWGAIQAAHQVGVNIIPVPSGSEGPEPDLMDRIISETGARAFYVQPNFANPTGARWSPDRVEAILAIAKKHGAFLVEDDWAHDFGIREDALPLAARDDSGSVIYVRSLSKSVSPSIRVAAILARGPVRDRILADSQAQNMYVSSVLQTAALDVVTQPAWRTHLRQLRRDLAARQRLMLGALSRHVPEAEIDAVPDGGLSLWARLPDDTDLRRLALRCEARGVLIATGDDWFPAEPTGRFIRLSFVGPDPARFDSAIAILGDSLRRRVE